MTGARGRGREAALSAFALAVAVTFVVDLAFGGATRPGALSTLVTRLASLPLLGLALWRLRRQSLGRLGWIALAMLAVMILVPVAQIIPLPPNLWSALPGRAFIARSYQVVGIAPPWLPISLTPYETQDAPLWFIPPAALFLSLLSLRAEERRTVALIVPAVAIVAVGLGMLQVVGGPESHLRFYSVTNPDSAVGFFANRNHQAAFLVCALALTPLWLETRLRRSGGAVGLVIALASELVLVVGIAVTHSRAGVLIGGGVLALSAVAALLLGDSSGARRGARALAGMAVLGLLVTVLFVGGALSVRFSSTLASDLRAQSAPFVEQAIHRFFPFGSGVGSFDPVYRMVEPIEQLNPLFFNHAHNDLLEMTLEGGALTIAVLAAFLIWWTWAATRAFRPETARLLRILGALAVAALMVHSLADYPLRTTALSCVFALGCGLLAAPRERERHRRATVVRNSSTEGDNRRRPLPTRQDPIHSEHAS